MCSLPSSLEVNRIQRFFFPLCWFSPRCTLQSGFLSSQSKVPTHAVGFGSQHHVCVYAHTYIYTTGVHLALAAVFSLVVKREIWLKVLL